MLQGNWKNDISENSHLSSIITGSQLMCDIVTNVATNVLMFVGTKVFQSPNLCMKSFSHKPKTKLDFTLNYYISITFFWCNTPKRASEEGGDFVVIFLSRKNAYQYYCGWSDMVIPTRDSGASLTLKLLQHSHLHLQHLFGLLSRLHL